MDRAEFIGLSSRAVGPIYLHSCWKNSLKGLTITLVYMKVMPSSHNDVANFFKKKKKKLNVL